MTKLISDFSPIELSPEFSTGSNTINVQSSIDTLRSGVALIPKGVSPGGLSLYNAENVTNYGFADLYIHPEIPDTLLLTSRKLGTGTLPSKFHVDLDVTCRLGDGTRLKNALGDIALNDIFDRLKEPTGFADRTTTTISFDEGTRTFTIAPTGASFVFYIYGVEFKKTVAQTVVIPDTEGNHFIYFNQSGVLSTTETFTNELITDNAMVSIIHWNATDNVAIYVADERHSSFMQGNVHLYLHLSMGAQYRSGLALGNLIVDGDGSSNSHCTVSVDNGVIADEDLNHSITNGAPQTLSTVAQIPVYYKYGTGQWKKDTATNYPVKMGTTTLAYNMYSGGTWSQADVGNNNYVLAHIFACNDIYNPIIAVQGTTAYASATDARNAAHTEINSITHLPINEITPIATLMYQTSNAYTNDLKARIRSHATGENYVDWRTTFKLIK